MDLKNKIYIQIKIKPVGSKEQDLYLNQDETGRIWRIRSIFKSRWNRADLKNKIYIQIKQNPNGSKEQALSPNQDETGRIYLHIKMKRDGSISKSR